MTLEKITNHLYRTAPDHPFGQGPWITYGHLLCRPDGNLIVGTSSHFEENKTQLTNLGGVKYQYLTHRDEAHKNADWITDTFDAPLICHEKEKDAISKRCIVGNTIHQRTTIFADFEAILTPGHTPGSLCYLWQAPDARYLFTGDTVFFNNDRWEVFINIGTPEEMISSLNLIAGLDFDYIIPGAHTGNAGIEAVTKEKIQKNIDQIISRIRSDT